MKIFSQIINAASVWSVLIMTTSAFAQQTPWSTIVADSKTEPERLAVVDLQRYLGQVTGKIPLVVTDAQWKERRSPAVIVGSTDAPEVVKALNLERGTVGDDGYLLAERTLFGVQVVVAAGRTPQGTVNAVYGLLRELGFGFYLGSEAAPQALPDHLTSQTIVRTPVFKVRGVLPWYNFFNSPTSWDPPDHRAFVDQLIRSGANFVGFHTYDSEPFAAFEMDGTTTLGQRLFNTSQESWGSRAVPTKDFAGGMDKIYSQKFFGAETTQLTGNAVDIIRKEQNIMRDALAYARDRGLQTCLGFEISHDPTDPVEANVFSKRLTNMLKTYPMLDYVWLWQPETQGVQGFRADYTQHGLPGKPAPDSKLPQMARERTDVFRRVVERTAGERPFLRTDEAGNLARAMEGVRLEQYALIAHRILKEHAPRARLVISGWGGDERLLGAEYFEGLDKLLPKDVVFSALDHIIPRPRVDKAYHDLPSDRERWPIPWLEFDGDEWQPQAFVHIYQDILKDAHKSGSQGILGIHWRTRDVEENFGFTMAYAWQPGITAKEFFRDLAQRCYPPEIAPRMAELHEQLDALGYRWVGGGGQSECAPFTVGAGEEGKASTVAQVKQKCESLLPKSGNARARLQWLINTMNWVLHYRQAELDMQHARELLDRADSATTEARDLASQAQTLLTRGSLERAMQTYARRLTTRGEYGVLATVNVKAVPWLRELQKRAAKHLGTDAASSKPLAWNPDPMIVIPRLHTSAPAGKTLRISPIILGGGKAWLHYRALNSAKWNTLPVQIERGWVGQVDIPASAVHAPGIAMALSFDEDPQAAASYGPVTATVFDGKVHP